MFYVLSKIIGLFLNPMVWIVGLFLFSVLSKNQKRAKSTRLAGIITLLFFSNSLIFNEVVRFWEVDSKHTTQLEQNYDVGIVLSGMASFNADLNRMNFLRSSDRVWQAVNLYQENKIDKILITGGMASFYSKDTIESVVIADYLAKIGIPESDLLVEKQAKNTYENAQFTAQMLDTLPYKSYLLITSASHMRRSNACFIKAGMNCDLYPADHYSKARNYGISQILVPSAETLNNWVALLHEFFGIASYKIAGYI